MVDRGPVELHFMYVDAVQALQILWRRFEEGPLIAFEVDGTRESHGACRIDAEGVQEFDPQVDVAITLAERSIRVVQSAGRVCRGVKAEQSDHCRITSAALLRPAKADAGLPPANRGHPYHGL